MVIYYNSREVIVLANDSDACKAEYAETRDLDYDYERIEADRDCQITFAPIVNYVDRF